LAYDGACGVLLADGRPQEADAGCGSDDDTGRDVSGCKSLRVLPQVRRSLDSGVWVSVGRARRSEARRDVLFYLFHDDRDSRAAYDRWAWDHDGYPDHGKALAIHTRVSFSI